MTACRADRLGAALLALTLLASPAVAEDAPPEAPPPAEQPAAQEAPPPEAPPVLAKPIMSRPDDPNGPGPDPVLVEPPPPAAKAPGGSSADPRAVSFERAELQAPPAEAIGVLDAQRGGLAASLWDGTSAPVARVLLAHLPVTTESPALRHLSRRLLLTAGPAPKGAQEAPSLAEIRVERLLALGEPEAAVALADMAPAQVRGPGMALARVEAQLLAGKADGACAALPAVGDIGQDLMLNQVQVLCQIKAGNSLAANFGLDMLRGRKPVDTAFITAAEALSGQPAGKNGVASLKNPTPVQLAALVAAKLPLPADAVETARPGALKAIATSAATQPDLRLAAAERAESLGLIDTDTLRDAIDGYDFKPEELAVPLGRPDLQAGPRGLALLVRTAEANQDPVMAAEIAAKALEVARARGRYATAARLLAPLVQRLPVQPPLIGFAPVAARAMLTVGRGDAALVWLNLAAQDPDAAKAAVALWPLARVYGIGDAGAGSEWRQGAGPRRAAIAFGLLAGLGQRIPDAELAALFDVPAAAGPPMAQAMLLDGLARDKALGGTVLAALAAFERMPLDKADALTLSRVVAALKAVGLEDAARAIAVEALLAAGV
jgi:hypothetical protein